MNDMLIEGFHKASQNLSKSTTDKRYKKHLLYSVNGLGILSTPNPRYVMHMVLGKLPEEVDQLAKYGVGLIPYDTVKKNNTEISYNEKEDCLNIFGGRFYVRDMSEQDKRNLKFSRSFLNTTYYYYAVNQVVWKEMMKKFYSFQDIKIVYRDKQSACIGKFTEVYTEKSDDGYCLKADIQMTDKSVETFVLTRKVSQITTRFLINLEGYQLKIAPVSIGIPKVIGINPDFPEFICLDIPSGRIQMQLYEKEYCRILE